jgi:hypothetical protein
VVLKMVGKKGRSGRKKNESGRKMRAVALYIPMTEIDTAHFNSTSARYEWIPDSWFRQFKRINGNRWQERVRTIMNNWVRTYQSDHMWCCECQGQIMKWHFRHEAECHRCNKRPSDIERFKTVAEMNKYIHKPASSTPLTLCPIHDKPLEPVIEIVSGNETKIMRCEDCK